MLGVAVETKVDLRPDVIEGFKLVEVESSELSVEDAA